MLVFCKVLHAAIIEKRDILGAAETGSGKTLAFGIPLLHHLLKDKVDKENPKVNFSDVSFLLNF